MGYPVFQSLHLALQLQKAPLIEAVHPGPPREGRGGLPGEHTPGLQDRAEKDRRGESWGGSRATEALQTAHVPQLPSPGLETHAGRTDQAY